MPANDMQNVKHGNCIASTRWSLL